MSLESIVWLIIEIAVVFWALQLVVGLLQSDRSAPGIVRTRPVYDSDIVRGIMVLVVLAILWHVFIAH